MITVPSAVAITRKSTIAISISTSVIPASPDQPRRGPLQHRTIGCLDT